MLQFGVGKTLIMNKLFSALFLLLFPFRSILAQDGFGIMAPGESPARYYEALVWLKSGYAYSNLLLDLSVEMQGVGARKIEVEKLDPHFELYLFRLDRELSAPEPERVTLDFLRKIRSHFSVAIAQLNHAVNFRQAPNDPSYANQQWQFNNTGQGGGTAGADISAEDAWDVTTGGLTALGDTIVVAVIDAGFQRTHTDLAPNMWRNYNEIPNNGIDDDGNGYIDDVYGWNAYNNNGNINSDQHGTHVAGIIGARGNNGTGVTGVNWNVKILPVSGSSGTEATVVSAYAYVANLRRIYNQTQGQSGAFIVATNSSFGVDYGNPANFPIWCAFYDTLGAYGILSAAAGPNNNVDVDAVGDIPSTCPSAFLIGVTNTTRNDTRNSSCGYGSLSIDLGAPGTQIYSTVPSNQYQSLTGTSMATPHVAGAIGLYYSAACANFIQQSYQNPSVMALQMRQWLLAGVDPIPALNGITVTGGRLNLLKGIQGVQSFNCNPNQPPVAQFSQNLQTGCPGLSVQFSNTSLGQIDSLRWFFPGGNPSTSVSSSVTVTYNQLGQYPVTLYVYNAFGTDSISLSPAVNISNSATGIIFSEDFEGQSFASLGWTSINPSGNAQWSLFNVSGTSPGNKAAGVNIFQNQSEVGQKDSLISPALDFTKYSNIILSLEHAHRRRITTVRDSLFILAYSDQQPLPVSLLRIAENGQGNFATNFTSTSQFIPSSAADWCFSSTTPASCIQLSLAAFDGHSNVRLVFVVENRGGNNIFIDNIEVSGICSGFTAGPPPVAGFVFQNNQICEGDSIQFMDISTGDVDSIRWHFFGGNPPSSNIPNPWVQYSLAGIYPVKLIAYNSYGSDSLILNIHVEAPLPVPIISENNGVLSAPPAAAYQWITPQGPIPGAISQQFTPSSSGLYGVIVTGPGGCTTQSAWFNLVLSADFAHHSPYLLYPNPAFNHVNIQADKIPVRLVLLDGAGRIIRTQYHSFGISLEGVSPGWYQIRIEDENRVVHLPLIVLP